MSAQAKHFLSQIPQHLEPVLSAAMDRFRLGLLSIHGPGHWLKVFGHATNLAGQTSGADLLVCQLFALLHDCERWDDGHDPLHGPRAAVVARELFHAGMLKITDLQLNLLCRACEGHTTERCSDDPTIGVCWDADRLDLPRVGMRVDARYLSTAAAKARIAR